MFHVKQNLEKDQTMADTVKTLTAKIKLVTTANGELEAEIAEMQAHIHSLETPTHAYYNLMESINFSAEVQRGGDYRVTNQTEFDRRIIGEAIIDKCFYLINGKGPNTTQQGLTGRVANLTAQANRVKVSEGYDSPLFIATLAELEAATTKLEMMQALDVASRGYHEQKTPNRNGLAYCAYGEERQGNARYQKLGISVDLDEPANAKAQADRIDLEEDIRVTLDAAANH